MEEPKILQLDDTGTADDGRIDADILDIGNDLDSITLINSNGDYIDTLYYNSSNYSVFQYVEDSKKELEKIEKNPMFTMNKKDGAIKKIAAITRVINSFFDNIFGEGTGKKIAYLNTNSEESVYNSIANIVTEKFNKKMTERMEKQEAEKAKIESQADEAADKFLKT